MNTCPVCKLPIEGHPAAEVTHVACAMEEARPAREAQTAAYLSMLMPRVLDALGSGDRNGE